MFAGELTYPAPVHFRNATSAHSLASETTIRPERETPSNGATLEDILEVQREHKGFSTPYAADSHIQDRLPMTIRPLSPVRRANATFHELLARVRDSFFGQESVCNLTPSLHELEDGRQTPLKFDHTSIISGNVEEHEWSDGAGRESSIEFRPASNTVSSRWSIESIASSHPESQIPISALEHDNGDTLQTISKVIRDTYDSYFWTYPQEADSCGPLPTAFFALKNRLRRLRPLPTSTYPDLGHEHERVLVSAYHGDFSDVVWVVNSIPIHKLKLHATLECYHQLGGVWKIIKFFSYTKGYVLAHCVKESTREQTDILIDSYHCITHATASETVAVLTLLARLTLTECFTAVSSKTEKIMAKVKRWAGKNKQDVGK
ncbi:hypothetical protein C8F04DRAFT_1190645 [Mycena alexandri]|uniref:Uncharacterized protein n=1 Tax=Mycena alexandri TaxID=1745969 RepID=A0AAD6SFM6_9AGAR|nr:hypothetical protein C8F04DRAFT_1190645 [Mycena alexandri]